MSDTSDEPTDANEPIESEPARDAAAPEAEVAPPPEPVPTVTRKGASLAMAGCLVVGLLLGWAVAGATGDDDSQPVSFQEQMTGQDGGPGGHAYPGGPMGPRGPEGGGHPGGPMGPGGGWEHHGEGGFEGEYPPGYDEDGGERYDEDEDESDDDQGDDEGTDESDEDDDAPTTTESGGN